MDRNITFYNRVFYIINGALLGNFTGVFYYVFNNKDNFNFEEMINNGASFATITASLVYLIYRIRDNIGIMKEHQ
jgi:hypothetical protein